jgi:transcriptional regulator with XRE-family HTH domain
MSQDELAEKLNVTRQSVSLWENGQTQPSLEIIVALAKLFKVSTDELLVSDKTEPATVSNTVTEQKPDAPKKKTKIFILILGVAIALALVTVAIVLLVRNNNSENDVDEDDPQITTSAVNSTSRVDTTETDTSKTDAVEKEMDIFGYLKDFVIENGTINGDYCYYSKSADNYGGYASENFSLYYWGDTNKMEFCLHSVIDETFSINFYLYVPENHSGKYEYISSYYYRDTGEPLYEARGIITAKDFTSNYPLNCTKYIGSTDNQNSFMETSRQGVCDLIGCLERFIEVENIKYSFKDFGFLKFKLDRA